MLCCLWGGANLIQIHTHKWKGNQFFNFVQPWRRHQEKGGLSKWGHWRFHPPICGCSMINTLITHLVCRLVMLTGGQRCSQTATVQTGAVLSVYICPSFFSRSPQQCIKCQWSPAWAQLLHCCPARLPDVASAAFSHVDWNQHYVSSACVLSSLLLSVLLWCLLLIVHAAHSANEPVQCILWER